jgi:hypothetical protein
MWSIDQSWELQELQERIIHFPETLQDQCHINNEWVCMNG